MSDIVRKEGNNICNDGSYKKTFKGEKNVCYLSLSMDRITRDFAIGTCPYMSGELEMQFSSGNYIFYSKCNYSKEDDKKLGK